LELEVAWKGGPWYGKTFILSKQVENLQEKV
jgi:hypothetical protein